MLPVEGCKPIFVDSTCCPVRYDCTSKTSGKSSQEVRYRKSSNKHYLRISQRLQRNRGCTVGKQYYVEGQKMKSDADNPCDICFCIRGNRRCAPKKCSPALKNCVPVVPKGQCCPSSYDCGSQSDHNRAFSARQFSLFSFLFHKEDEGNNTNFNGIKIPAEYPPDRHPSVIVTHKESIQEKNDEKSILDQIREGLEIIDGNNEDLIAKNIDKLAEQTAQLSAEAKIESSTAPTAIDATTMTDVNFLDLLLDAPEEELVTQVIKDVVSEVKIPTVHKELSWVDLLLGPDDEEDKKSMSTTVGERPEHTTDITTQYQRADGTELSKDHIIGGRFEDDDILSSGEIIVNAENEMDAHSNSKLITVKTTELDNTTGLFSEHTEPPSELEITTKASTGTTTTVIKSKHKTTTPISIFHDTKSTVKKHIKTTTTTSLPLLHKTTATLLQDKGSAASSQKNDLLLTLLDGLSNILSAEAIFNESLPNVTVNVSNNLMRPSTQSAANKSSTSLSPLKLLPSFKPLPTNKSHKRINSKIANLTLRPAVVGSSNVSADNITAFKPLPPQTIKKSPLVSSTTTTTNTTAITTTTASPASSISISTTPRATLSTTKITKTANNTNGGITSTTTTVKPLIIKTNPTILESDSFDANANPTLPPSLPNLKIIPFLPTDAVKTDRKKPLYEYYHSNAPTVKIDYEQYDEDNMYPALTERFPTYAEVDESNKAEYIYKFNVEGPVPPVVISPTAGKLDSAAADTASYIKYDFVNGEMSHKGFSPPAKTEGGFMPKEPLIIDDDEVNEVKVAAGNAAKEQFAGDSYQVTQHIIDITTSDVTKVIEITTPDPFRDVIRTEPPPDLSLLIGDKAKILVSKQQQWLTHAAKENPAELTSMQETHVINSFAPNEDIRLQIANQFSSNSKVTTKATSTDAREAIFLDMLHGGDTDDMVQPSTVVNGISSTMPFKTLPSAAVGMLQTTTPKSAQSTKSTAKTAQLKTSAFGTAIIPNQKMFTQQRTKTSHINATRNKSKTNQGSLRNQTTTTALTTITSDVASSRPKLNKAKTNSTSYSSIITANSTSKQNMLHKTRSTAITTLANVTTTTSISTVYVTDPISTTKPVLNSLFDTLPFMDASYEVKRLSITASPAPPLVAQNTFGEYFDLLDSNKTLHQFEGFEMSQKTTKVALKPTPPTTTSAPLTQREIVKNINSKGVSATFNMSVDPPVAYASTHSALNSLIDPTGILKLAGCNIYGRMYRVGRIILELSSPCLECKCTEVGVKCGQLAC